MVFYVTAAVICAVSFAADMILRYMEKIRSFGMEQRLHNIKGSLIPIEDLIPHNITMVTVWGMAMGSFGIVFKLLGVNGLVCFPCAAAFGCIVNFTVMHFIKPFFEEVSGAALSEKDDISGMEAVCTAVITQEGYGRIELSFKGRRYEFDAVTVNGSRIEPDEKTYILYRQDGLCFVEKQSEVTDILNEDMSADA